MFLTQKLVNQSWLCLVKRNQALLGSNLRGIARYKMSRDRSKKMSNEAAILILVMPKKIQKTYSYLTLKKQQKMSQPNSGLDRMVGVQRAEGVSDLKTLQHYNYRTI